MIPNQPHPKWTKDREELEKLVIILQDEPQVHLDRLPINQADRIKPNKMSNYKRKSRDGIKMSFPVSIPVSSNGMIEAIKDLHTDQIEHRLEALHTDYSDLTHKKGKINLISDIKLGPRKHSVKKREHDAKLEDLFGSSPVKDKIKSIERIHKRRSTVEYSSMSGYRKNLFDPSPRPKMAKKEFVMKFAQQNICHVKFQYPTLLVKRTARVNYEEGCQYTGKVLPMVKVLKDSVTYKLPSRYTIQAFIDLTDDCEIAPAISTLPSSIEIKRESLDGKHDNIPVTCASLSMPNIDSVVQGLNSAITAITKRPTKPSSKPLRPILSSSCKVDRKLTNHSVTSLLVISAVSPQLMSTVTTTTVPLFPSRSKIADKLPTVQSYKASEPSEAGVVTTHSTLPTATATPVKSGRPRDNPERPVISPQRVPRKVAATFKPQTSDSMRTKVAPETAALMTKSPDRPPQRAVTTPQSALATITTTTTPIMCSLLRSTARPLEPLPSQGDARLVESTKSASTVQSTVPAAVARSPVATAPTLSPLQKLINMQQTSPGIVLQTCVPAAQAPRSVTSCRNVTIIPQQHHRPPPPYVTSPHARVVVLPIADCNKQPTVVTTTWTPTIPEVTSVPSVPAGQEKKLPPQLQLITSNQQITYAAKQCYSNNSYESISNEQCAEGIYPYFWRINLLRNVGQRLYDDLKQHLGKVHANAEGQGFVEYLDVRQKKIGGELVSYLRTIDVRDFNGPPMLDIVGYKVFGTSHDNRKLCMMYHQLKVFFDRYEGYCDTPFTRKFRSHVNRVNDKLKPSAPPRQLDKLYNQIIVYNGIVRTHQAIVESERKRLAEMESAAAARRHFLAEQNRQRQQQPPPVVTEVIAPPQPVSPIIPPIEVPIVKMTQTEIVPGSPINLDPDDEDEPSELIKTKVEIKEESILRHQSVIVSLQVQPECCDRDEEEIEKIDLTWLQDVDPVEFWEEVADNELPIKMETSDTDSAREEPDESRESVSPTDSGLGSPKDDGNHSSNSSSYSSKRNDKYMCLCGNPALFVCACNQSTYCSRDCQVVHWSEHQRICDRFSSVSR